MRHRIRLTESDLHNIIKESVKTLLNEYEWNGRTPQQDAASIRAANANPSWKPMMYRAQQQQQQGKGYNYNLTNKARDTFHNQYGTANDYYEDNFKNGGHNSNAIRGTITDINTNGGRLAFNQRDRSTNGERYHEKNYGDYTSQNMKNITPNDYQNGYINNFGGGYNNVWGQKGDASKSLLNSHEENQRTRNNRYLSMSPQFKQRLTNMDNDMTDFYSGNYGQRMNAKRNQLGNKGNY